MIQFRRVYSGMINQARQVIRHQHFAKFLVYCAAIFLYGTIAIGLGTLIPYLAEAQGRDSTQYSLLFLARAIGFVVAALTINFVQKYLNYHQALTIGLLSGGAFAVAFNFTQNLYLSCLWMFLSSFGCCYISIFCNIATIYAFKEQNLDKWLQVLHGCSAVGGLLGPFIVYLFGLNTFVILGGSVLALSPFILKFKSPEISTNNNDYVAAAQTSMITNSQNSSKNINFISNFCTFLLCISFWLIVGQEKTFQNWIPSYAVQSGFSTKQHAALYVSLYWISISFFRFAFVFIPGSAIKRFPILTMASVFGTPIIMLFIYEISTEAGLIISAIIYGFGNSCLFPLLLSLPNLFGLDLSPSKNSYFILFAAFGEGTIAVGTGYLMKLIDYKIIFFTMMITNLMAFFNHYKICSVLKSQKGQQLNEQNNQQPHLQPHPQ